MLEGRRRLLGGAGAICAAAFIPMTAQAQSAASPPAARGDPAVENTVGEVVVTAQRRTERALDVPLSITAATGETLEKAGVTNSADLNKVAPGFMMFQFGSAPQPVIRGISSGGASPGDSSNVAVYVDGVYMGNMEAQLFDLPDIERVEVLKGPQGTLFGRNAAGGAIRVITKEPTFTPTGSFTASYGSFNNWMLKGVASGPLAPKIAGSLAAYYEQDDGWAHNVATGKRAGGLDSRLVRGKLLFEPSEDLKITVGAFYLRRSNHNFFDGNALDGNTVARAVNPSAMIVTTPRDTAVDGSVGGGVRSYGASLNATYDTPFGTLTSVSAYQKGHSWRRVDADYTPLNLVFYNLQVPWKNLSEEVNFASSKFGRFSFALGGFLYKATEQSDPQQVLAGPSGPSIVDVYAKATTLAAAVFGEGTVDITDRLQGIVGLRYSYEKQKMDRAFGSPNITPLGRASFRNTSPRVSLKYNVTPDSNIYFTYSKGFKSGIFSPTGTAAPLLPEHVTAYEVGAKARLTPQLSFTAALYKYDYKDLQIQTVTQIVTSGSGAGFQNAASANIKGFEADLDWAATHDLTFRAGLSLLRAKYGRFDDAVVTVPITLPSGAPCNCGGQQGAVNITGYDLVRSPRWTANLTAEYAHEFSAGTGSANLTVFHTDSWWADLPNRVEQKPYTTVDGMVSWRPTGSNWKFTVWGKNLTDETYVTSYFITNTSDGVDWAAPRSGGVRVDYAF